MCCWTVDMVLIYIVIMLHMKMSKHHNESRKSMARGVRPTKTTVRGLFNRRRRRNRRSLPLSEGVEPSSYSMHIASGFVCYLCQVPHVCTSARLSFAYDTTAPLTSFSAMIPRPYYDARKSGGRDDSKDGPACVTPRSSQLYTRSN